jgi:hypothetical protein
VHGSPFDLVRRRIAKEDLYGVRSDARQAPRACDVGRQIDQLLAYLRLPHIFLMPLGLQDGPVTTDTNVDREAWLTIPMNALRTGMLANDPTTPTTTSSGDAR